MKQQCKGFLFTKPGLPLSPGLLPGLWAQLRVPWRLSFSLLSVSWPSVLSSQVCFSLRTSVLRARASFWEASSKAWVSSCFSLQSARALSECCSFWSSAAAAERAFPRSDRASPSSSCSWCLALSRDAFLALASCVASAASCNWMASFFLRKRDPEMSEAVSPLRVHQACPKLMKPLDTNRMTSAVVLVGSSTGSSICSRNLPLLPSSLWLLCAHEFYFCPGFARLATQHILEFL